MSRNTAKLLFVTVLLALPGTGICLTSGAHGQLTQVASKQTQVTSAFEAGDITPSPVTERVGVLVNESRAFGGYNLISPKGNTTYLFDNEGRVVHSWTSKANVGVAYLLDNGHLFCTVTAGNRPSNFRGPAGASGGFQELDWDSNVIWDFEYHSDKRWPHHDAIKLPNGNVLLICWEMIDEEEAIAMGCPRDRIKNSHLQPDCLVEIQPTGPKSGKVVWEWRAWDHLIQDHDRTKPNYGDAANHPGRIDLNYPGSGDERDVRDPDWMHCNSVAYNPVLDQIVVSCPNFNEIWIIDHSTTAEEAKGHTGGRWGKGGDLLYRWGNPSAYRSGSRVDQQLFFQHNAHWIPTTIPGEGCILVFNNGGGREPLEYSSVDEFVPPTDEAGNYIRRKRSPYGPGSPFRSYTARNKTDFASSFISGAQRLPNGNTLVNSGVVGVVFEVTPDKEIVWKFVNPIMDVSRKKGAPQPAADSPPKPFAVFSETSTMRSVLRMKEDQLKKLDEIDAALNETINEVLDAAQRKVLVEPNNIEYSRAPAGEYLSMFDRSELKLSQSQKETLQTLRRDANSKISMTLTDGQKRTIQRRKTSLGLPKRPGNSLFRATRYGLKHPAFDGKVLTPGKTLVAIQEDRQQSATEQN